MSNIILSKEDEFPAVRPIVGLPKCIAREGIPCKTLVYAPQTIDWVNELMHNLAARANLKFEEDILPMGSGTSGSGYVGFQKDNETLFNYFINNQNATQNGIIFTSGINVSLQKFSELFSFSFLKNKLILVNLLHKDDYLMMLVIYYFIMEQIQTVMLLNFFIS